MGQIDRWVLQCQGQILYLGCTANVKPTSASRLGPLTAWTQGRALRNRLDGSRSGIRLRSLPQSQTSPTLGSATAT